MTVVNSKRILAIVIAANIFAVASALFLAYHIQNKYAKSLELNTKLIDEKLKIEDLKSLKSLVDNTKEQRADIKNLFISKESIIDFLSFVESLGESSGAKVEVISVDEGNSEDDSGSVKIRFKISGIWSQVYKTVSLTDHLPYAFWVTELQISKESDDLETGASAKKTSKTNQNWSAIVEGEVIKLP